MINVARVVRAFRAAGAEMVRTAREFEKAIESIQRVPSSPVPKLQRCGVCGSRTDVKIICYIDRYGVCSVSKNLCCVCRFKIEEGVGAPEGMTESDLDKAQKMISHDLRNSSEVSDND